MLKRFTDILGQPDAIDWLNKAWRANHLPHGLLFAGAMGVGKATTAAALGALFLCHTPTGASPCGKCDSCRVLDAGNHPDYAVIDRTLVRTIEGKEDLKAKDLSIHVIRRFLLDRAAMTPMLNHGRVFIIEEAELMNAAAQNALLKTLEEPNGRTLIILLCDDAQSMLPTIRSRTQLVRFALLEPQIVMQQLLERGIDQHIAQPAAHLADGSIGAALKWIEDGIITGATELLHHVDQMLSHRPAPDLGDWFIAAADAYAKKQQDRDDKASLDQAKREGFSLYLRLLADHFRKLLITRDNPALIDRACAAIDQIAQADQHIQANVNTAIIARQLALNLKRG